MYSFVPDFLLQYIELWSFYFLALGTLKKKITFSGQILLKHFLFSVLLTAIEFLSVSDVWITVIQCIVLMVFFMLGFKDTFLKNTYLTAFVFTCNMGIQFATILPVVIFDLATDKSTTQFVGISTTLLIAFLCYRIFPLNRLWKFIFRSDFRFFMLITNIGLLSLGLLLSYKLSQEYFFPNYIIYFLFFSVILFMNWELYRMNLKLKNEEKEVQTYQQYMPIIEELLDEVRIRQHNFDNTTQAILNLHHTHHDYESLVKAMECYGKTAFASNPPSNLLKLNYKLVIGFLHLKETTAKQQGKFIDITIENYVLQTVLPEYVLVELLGILIDNALEAVPRGEAISVTIDSNSGFVECEVCNPGTIIDGELLDKLFQKGYTTKNDHSAEHGLGLYYLKKKLEAYNGAIYFKNKDIHGQNYVSFSFRV